MLTSTLSVPCLQTLFQQQQQQQQQQVIKKFDCNPVSKLTLKSPFMIIFVKP